MGHSVLYVTPVSEFLDQAIQGHGEYRFVGFVFLCFLITTWIVVRRRGTAVHDIPVVSLPLGYAPRREPDPGALRFQQHPDP
jgi:hypothetical protein